jgi:hypothetical protein
MNCDHEDPEARLEERLRQLGTHEPRCSVQGCPEADPFALSGVHPNLLCVEHEGNRSGRTWLQGHHLKGKRNDPSDVFSIPANDHALLSEYQRSWPRDTLRNPDGSPLLLAAAALRGWLDVLRLILERTVGWIPGFLERLDAWLRHKVGKSWWHEFDAWLRASNDS